MVKSISRWMLYRVLFKMIDKYIFSIIKVTQGNLKKVFGVLGWVSDTRRMVGIIGLMVLGLIIKSEAVSDTSTNSNSENKVYVSADKEIFQNREGEAEMRARLQKKFEWDIQTTWGAYQKVGIKNEKWDPYAKDIFTYFSKLRMYNNRYGDELYDGIEDLTTRLIALGCNDPLLEYMGLAFGGKGRDLSPKELFTRYQNIAEALDGKRYPASRCFYAYLRVLDVAKKFSKQPNNNIPKGSFKELISLAKAWLEEMVKDPETPQEELYEACDGYMEKTAFVLLQRWQPYKDIDRMFEIHLPQSPVRYLVRGKFYIDSGWDVRAGKSNDQSTPIFRDAKASLEEAWRLDPKSPRAATLMLTLALGEGMDREEMELWFRRAMQADPNNLDACHRKLYYLEPQWHGSAADMLQFARTCYQAGNWEGRLPFILVDTHHQLAEYEPDLKNYYKSSKDAWNDIRSVYEEFLTRYPDARTFRTSYARYACLCQQWKVAKAQFKILGNKVRQEIFENKAEYERMKAEADKKG